MSQINSDHHDYPSVRQTEIKTWLTDETMSPLGIELMRIAREIELSDEPALDEKSIESELQKRRGGLGHQISET